MNMFLLESLEVYGTQNDFHNTKIFLIIIIYSLLLSNSTSIPESGLVHEADMSVAWTCDLDGDLVFFFAGVLPTFVMALPSDLPDLPLCRDGLSSQTVFTRGAGGYDNGK